MNVLTIVPSVAVMVARAGSSRDPSVPSPCFQVSGCLFKHSKIQWAEIFSERISLFSKQNKFAVMWNVRLGRFENRPRLGFVTASSGQLLHSSHSELVQVNAFVLSDRHGPVGTRESYRRRPGCVFGEAMW